MQDLHCKNFLCWMEHDYESPSRLSNVIGWYRVGADSEKEVEEILSQNKVRGKIKTIVQDTNPETCYFAKPNEVLREHLESYNGQSIVHVYPLRKTSKRTEELFSYKI